MKKAQFSLVPLSRFIGNTKALVRNLNYETLIVALISLTIILATALSVFS
jgi:hypothetical protein